MRWATASTPTPATGCQRPPRLTPLRQEKVDPLPGSTVRRQAPIVNQLICPADLRPKRDHADAPGGHAARRYATGVASKPVGNQANRSVVPGRASDIRSYSAVREGRGHLAAEDLYASAISKHKGLASTRRRQPALAIYLALRRLYRTVAVDIDGTLTAAHGAELDRDVAGC